MGIKNGTRSIERKTKKTDIFKVIFYSHYRILGASN